VGYYLKKTPAQLREMSIEDLAQAFEWVRYCRKEELKQSLKIQGL
jgi:hypothetical protein